MRCLHISSGERMWLGCAETALPGGGGQRVILGSEGDVGVGRGRGIKSKEMKGFGILWKE